MDLNNISLDDHFDLLLIKYDLKGEYYKFIISNGITRILRESFLWALLYLSNLLKDNPKNVLKYSVYLITIWGIHVPFDRLNNYLKSDFLEKLKLVNTKYFNDRIINQPKDQAFMFDLVEYYTMLNNFNTNFEDYVNNIKTKHDIPYRCILILIIAFTRDFIAIIGLFTVYYFIVRSLNEHKYIKEKELLEKYLKYDEIIRNYIINSKNLLINNELNIEYLNTNVDQFENISTQIISLNNNLDMNVDFVMLGMIISIIWMKFKHLNQYDFLYYFLLINDVEYIGDKITEYYKNKSILNKMQIRLNNLNNYQIKQQIVSKEKINKILITELSNDKPFIKITNPIEINSNDHILLEGESGSGKTTLFYILKGILKPDNIKISPDIDVISSQSYLTLPNHKSLYSGKLYDIITNYSMNPDIKLINFALETAKINNILNNNDIINVEKLSSGERIRLLIARIIYVVKTKNFNLLLFDEIDENLNNDLAIEIWNNLNQIFNDKIIIYITHNDEVKKLFSKKLFVNNGKIKPNQ